MNSIFSLGIMNGTSMDGIDCCFAEINLSNSYNFKYNIVKQKYIPFRDIDILKIKNALNTNGKFNYSLDKYLGELYFDIVNFIFR